MSQPPSNVHRMMTRVHCVIPADAAAWFKEKQYLDQKGYLDVLGILEARLGQERRKYWRLLLLIYLPSILFLTFFTLALKFWLK